MNDDGYLIVNDMKLDRDPPNPDVYTFQVFTDFYLNLARFITPYPYFILLLHQQVIARQIGILGDKGVSSPVTINVHLIDVNDNPPKLPAFSPIHIQAGEGTRKVFKVSAHF